MVKKHIIYIKNNTSLKQTLLVGLISLLYLLMSYMLIGFKTDQLFLVVLFNSFYFISLPSRKFILGFLIFIVFWVIFDTMKAFPNYNVNDIHIKDLYENEKVLFGITENGIVLTPNEYAQQHSLTFLDVLSGLFYINWVPIPLLFAFYLFRKNKMQFLHFSMAFLFVNILGFVVYYVYPAAPPWYVQQYGFDLHFNTPGNPAGLIRFDEYFGLNIFGSMYTKSSNVFAAMPSLHSAYPVVVFYYALKNKLGYINIFFALFMFGIWFSAVYTSHHYIIDVLAGISCAVVGILIFEKILTKQTFMRNFMFRYNNHIS